MGSMNARSINAKRLMLLIYALEVLVIPLLLLIAGCDAAIFLSEARNSTATF